VHSFARAAEEDEAADAGFGEVDGVGDLCVDVEGWGDGVVVLGGFGGEEGWRGDVDACGRGCLGFGHDCVRVILLLGGRRYESMGYDLMLRCKAMKYEIPGRKVEEAEKGKK